MNKGIEMVGKLCPTQISRYSQIIKFLDHESVNQANG